jgi:hypothetical protein
MASDASVALGAPQLAGSFVNPKGLTRAMTARAAGGVVGGEIASAAAGAANQPGQEGTPDFGRVGFLAASAEELALVKTKSGLLKMKVTEEVLARAPRSQIASAELDRGALKSTLKIQFADGGLWEFDVPKANRKTAEQLVGALGGQIV